MKKKTSYNIIELVEQDIINIYDANIDKIATLPSSIDLTELSDIPRLISNHAQEISELIEQGFFQELLLENIQNPRTNDVVRMISENIGSLHIQITTRCTLDCIYCIDSCMYHASKPNPLDISLENAKKAVDLLMSNSSKMEKLIIGFYGGEPLIRYDLIKKLVDYALSVTKKPIEFTITTNMTIISDEIIDFLSQNNFKVGVSIDGPQEIHDRNRVFIGSEKQGSFESVMSNLKYIRIRNKDLYSKLYFMSVRINDRDFYIIEDFFLSMNKMYFGDENINNYGMVSVRDGYNKQYCMRHNMFMENEERNILSHKIQSIRTFKNIFLKYLFTFLIYLDYYKEEFFDAYKHLYLKVFLIELRTMHKIQYEENVILKNNDHPPGPCIAGCKALYVDATGKYWPCVSINKDKDCYCIGDTDKGIDINRVEKLLNICRENAENCKTCFAFRKCGQCAEKLSYLSWKESCDSIRGIVHELIRMYCSLTVINEKYSKLRYNKENFLQYEKDFLGLANSLSSDLKYNILNIDHKVNYKNKALLFCQLILLLKHKYNVHFNIEQLSSFTNIKKFLLSIQGAS